MRFKVYCTDTWVAEIKANSLEECQALIEDMNDWDFSKQKILILQMLMAYKMIIIIQLHMIWLFL